MLVERMNVQLNINPNDLNQYLAQGFKKVEQEKKNRTTVNKKQKKTK